MKARLYNRLNFQEKTVYSGTGYTTYGDDEDGCEVRSTSYGDHYRTSYSGCCISDYNSILKERWEQIKSIIAEQENDFIPIASEEPHIGHTFEHNADYSYTHKTYGL
jgi:hypothetical protein